MSVKTADTACVAHVWIELFDKWEPAVAATFTQAEAEALAVVLGAMRPELTFVASIGRPMTVAFPLRRAR